jgi:hypothetical protein
MAKKMSSNFFQPTLSGNCPLTLSANGFSNLFTINFSNVAGSKRFQIYDSTLPTNYIEFGAIGAQGFINLNGVTTVNVNAPIFNFGSSLHDQNNGEVIDTDHYFYDSSHVKILAEQQPAVADASATLVSLQSQLNALLACLRTHGLIAP